MLSGGDIWTAEVLFFRCLAMTQAVNELVGESDRECNGEIKVEKR